MESGTEQCSGSRAGVRSRARQAFENCPLIEIVYFHDCLRGELRSLRANVDVLRNQMSELPVVVPAIEEGKSLDAIEGDSPAACPSPRPTAQTAPLPVEHLKLEFQVQSQFRLLWAVFQSHSTAEDEIIWPALKEKARSSGGKLRLVNNDEEAKSAASSSTSPMDIAPVSSNVTTASERDNANLGTSNDSMMTTQTAAPERAVEDGESGVGQGRCQAGKGDGEGKAVDAETGEEFQEAMIDEHEYTEEHSQEQRLFEGMQEVLTRLRNIRQSVPERLCIVARLSSKTEEMCRHLMTHLEKEEESALPLIRHYFTHQEMEALVGRIMGKRPTELMQTILAMMVKNLPSDEVSKMMGYMRQAVKDTYFEKWLRSGGFQWPADKDAESKGKGRAHGRSCKVGRGGRRSPNTVNTQSTSTAYRSGGADEGRPSGDDALLANEDAAAVAAAASTSMLAFSERLNKRPGSPLKAMGDAQGDGPAAAECSGSCSLNQEFSDLKLDRADPLSPSSSSRDERDDSDERRGRARDGGGGSEFSPPTDEDEGTRCAVCSYIGRCPAEEPLTQQEFEVAVRKLAQMRGLTTKRKNELVQALRNHMYQGRKRLRAGSGVDGGGSNDDSNLTTAFSVSIPRQSWVARPSVLPGGKGSVSGVPASAGLMAPARHYTSTQPDIEDASRAEPGSGWEGGSMSTAIGETVEGDAGKELGVGTFVPLFSREELAPTYHIPGPAPAVSSGGDLLSGKSVEIVLGCPHYRRSCKIRAACCQRLFTCRLCHDQASDHTMDREEVKEMLCMLCGTLQPVHSECRNPSCRTTDAESGTSRARKMARYYCGICHLFDDAPGKAIYHCPYCNVCRVGKGLGEDFFHCMKCNACISMSAPKHTCLSKSLESDCPICSGSLFTSTSQVKGLKCGHFLHLTCYTEYIRRAESRQFWYRCPICRKSIEDMREFFSQMDAVVASQPMPEEFAGWKTKVLCYDCEKYSKVPYHFLYHKCGACGSYNTRAEGQHFREDSSPMDVHRQLNIAQGGGSSRAPP